MAAHVGESGFIHGCLLSCLNEATRSAEPLRGLMEVAEVDAALAAWGPVAGAVQHLP